MAGCSAITGEEVARLPINQISVSDDNLIMKEASLALKKGDKIALWSEMDVKYEGDVLLRFKLEILKDGELFQGLEIDPTDKNITIGEVKSSIMGKTDWRFSGKNGQIKIEEDGHYTFKAIFVASNNPSLKVDKAELVLKK